MIKAVIDTNVVISGFFWSGPPKRIIEMMGSGFTAFATPEIIEEYEDVFGRYAKKTKIDTYPFFQYVLAKTTIVTAQQLSTQICEDPYDDMFIACAYAAKTPFIVTGDKKLLAAAPKASLTIMRPIEFLKMIRG